MTDVDQKARPETVIMGRDPEVLQGLLDFYARPGGRVLDACCNARRMWKGVAWAGPVTCMDVDPAVQPDVVGDWNAMPFPDASFDVVAWDPPHLPSAAGSEKSHAQMKVDYGLGRSVHGDNVSATFPGFLAQARRVLTPDGVLFAKLKDFVHNHAYQWTLVDFIQAVRATQGLTPCDLRIKRDPAGGNLKSGRWKKSYHARSTHSWWVVVRKGRCEPRKAGRT